MTGGARRACDLIGGRAVAIPGDELRSHNPARPGETIWEGSPVESHVDEAVAAARAALPAWRAMGREGRFAALRIYQRLARERADEVAGLIADEAGKALWESKQEAALLAGKVDITLDESAQGALSRVTGWETAIAETRTGRTSFRPHGVMAVLGPFNFPAHLPNGHIAPALAMGNTLVVKPPNQDPLGVIRMVELFEEAGLPPGVAGGATDAGEGGLLHRDGRSWCAVPGSFRTLAG